jgi:hypothetical protein
LKPPIRSSIDKGQNFRCTDHRFGNLPDKTDGNSASIYGGIIIDI